MIEKQYNYEQAAEVLAVSVQTIRRWVKTGKITRITALSGTAKRIPESALAELIEKQTESATADVQLGLF